MERQTIIGSLSTSGRLSGALSVGGGTTDYNELENKPTYNGHVIEGELTNESLGIWQPKNFSTEEQNTGLKWIDGKDIYIKTITTGQLGTTKTINHNISNLDKIIKIDGIALATNQHYYIPLPYGEGTTGGIVYTSGTSIIIVSNADFSGYNESYITLYYTKN